MDHISLGLPTFGLTTLSINIIITIQHIHCAAHHLFPQPLNNASALTTSPYITSGIQSHYRIVAHGRFPQSYIHTTTACPSDSLSRVALLFFFLSPGREEVVLAFVPLSSYVFLSCGCSRLSWLQGKRRRRRRRKEGSVERKQEGMLSCVLCLSWTFGQFLGMRGVLVLHPSPLDFVVWVFLSPSYSKDDAGIHYSGLAGWLVDVLLFS